MNSAIQTIEVDGEIRTVGRPDMRGYDMDWARTQARKHPKYVYGRRQGLLMHEVAVMEFQWWHLGDGGAYWVRAKSPRVTYTTKCGMFFFGPDPESTFRRDKRAKSVACELPRPNAVLCGRCRGEGPVFAKGTKPKAGGPDRYEARLKLGCVVGGVEVTAEDASTAR